MSTWKRKYLCLVGLCSPLCCSKVQVSCKIEAAHNRHLCHEEIGPVEFVRYSPAWYGQGNLCPLLIRLVGEKCKSCSSSPIFLPSTNSPLFFTAVVWSWHNHLSVDLLTMFEFYCSPLRKRALGLSYILIPKEPLCINRLSCLALSGLFPFTHTYTVPFSLDLLIHKTLIGLPGRLMKFPYSCLSSTLCCMDISVLLKMLETLAPLRLSDHAYPSSNWSIVPVPALPSFFSCTFALWPTVCGRLLTALVLRSSWVMIDFGSGLLLTSNIFIPSSFWTFDLYFSGNCFRCYM